MFDRKYTTINKLSKKLRELFNNIDKINKKDIDNFINSQLNCICVCFAQITISKKNKNIFKDKYFNKFEQIV